MPDTGSISLAFYEVILNDAGKPTGVVHITSSGTLAPDRSTFEATGRGAVYAFGKLIATNQTAAAAGAPTLRRREAAVAGSDRGVPGWPLT